MQVPTMQAQPSESLLPRSEHEFMYHRLCEVWKLKPQQSAHNPCAQPVPLTRSAMADTRAAEYLVTPKTDGIRFVLLLTTRPDGRPVSVMIGRNMQMYEVETMAPDDFHERGTLLDGELVWYVTTEHERCLHYVVFDAMAVAGKFVARDPLVSRLQAVSQCIGLTDAQRDAVRQYGRGDDPLGLDSIQFVVEESKVVATINNLHGLMFTTKPMLPASTWAGRVHGRCNQASAPPEGPLGAAYNLGDAGYPTDGLIFTPRDLPVYINTHRSMFKWKPQEHCTVDVCVRHGAFYVRATDNESTDALVELRSVECAPVSNAKATNVDDGVYECLIDVEGDAVCIEPVAVRTDKAYPNTAATVAGTLRSKLQNIPLDDLVAWCGQ